MVIKLLSINQRYANRLLLASSSTETLFGNLFPNRLATSRRAAAQAFVNVLSELGL